jgi:uncharacterized protein
MRWRVALSVVVLTLALGGCSAAGGSSADDSTDHGGHAADLGLPVITFTTGTGAVVPLAVEVADQSEETGCGLMHRTELPEEQGMIFVFTQDNAGGFWMRNTLIPLSIAYIAADGRIVDILDMEPVPAPGNTPYRLPDGRVVPVGDGQEIPRGAVAVTYPPREPYRYAIEVNQGWFARHGVAIGDRVDPSPALASADAAAPPPICAQRGVSRR